MDWPLHEVLLAYVERLRDSALETYQHATLVWAMTAPHSKKPSKPPRAPAILK